MEVYDRGAATPLPHISPSSISELSTVAHVCPPTGHISITSLLLWSREKLVQALKKLGYGVIGLEENEKSPPHPSAGFLPLTALKAINPGSHKGQGWGRQQADGSLWPSLPLPGIYPKKKLEQVGKDLCTGGITAVFLHRATVPYPCVQNF